MHLRNKMLRFISLAFVLLALNFIRTNLVQVIEVRPLVKFQEFNVDYSSTNKESKILFLKCEKDIEEEINQEDDYKRKKLIHTSGLDYNLTINFLTSKNFILSELNFNRSVPLYLFNRTFII